MSQALIDIVAEWTSIPDVECPEETTISATDGGEPWTLEYWCMNFHGSLTLQVAGTRVVLTSLDGHTLKNTVQMDF